MASDGNLFIYDLSTGVCRIGFDYVWTEWNYGNTGTNSIYLGWSKLEHEPRNPM